MTINYRLLVAKNDEGSFYFWIERKRMWFWFLLGGDSLFSYANLMNPEYPMHFWNIPENIKEILLLNPIRDYVRELDTLDVLPINSQYVLCNFQAEIVEGIPYFFGNTKGLVKTIV